MAQAPILQAISTLNKRIEALLHQQDLLQKKLKELEMKNHLLEIRHNEDSEKLRQAALDIEFLEMSHRLADSPDKIISTRRKIASWIRTIDNCIRMINEE